MEIIRHATYQTILFRLHTTDADYKKISTAVKHGDTVTVQTWYVKRVKGNNFGVTVFHGLKQWYDPVDKCYCFEGSWTSQLKLSSVIGGGAK